MSNLPAIPTAQEFQTMKELGQMAINSGFLPASIKTSEQAVVIMLKGRELGIPPMQAFSGINVIQGKPAVSPELMTALIYKNCPGAVINFVATNNTECVIDAKRPGGNFCRFSFTMEDARIAGLLGKGNWKTYPAAMLRARALSAMARALFADAIAGCSYTPEELGADVDDEGNVVSLPPENEGKTDSAPAPRDVTPPDESTQGAVETQSPTSEDPGDYKIKRGRKEWIGKTIREVVDSVGLPQFQKDVGWWVKESNIRNTHEIKELSVMTGRYTQALVKNRTRERFAPSNDWQNEDFDSIPSSGRSAR